MEHNKAPGPDGFLAEIYDLIDLFQEFHNGNLQLYSLNFGMIILLPKSREATRIQ
jgi:hypothetical protein